MEGPSLDSHAKAGGAGDRSDEGEDARAPLSSIRIPDDVSDASSEEELVKTSRGGAGDTKVRCEGRRVILTIHTPTVTNSTSHANGYF